MKLILVRHGQTDYNKAGIVQGQEKDVPINVEGIKQVEHAATLLPNDIDLLIASPLLRARQTAEILAKRVGKEIAFDDRVMEFKYGTLAGKTWAEIATETGDPDIYSKDQKVTFDYSPYGGESSTQVRSRVQNFVDDMKENDSNKTILIATHGGVIDTMHELYPDAHRPLTDNASIHEFSF